jgi:hypothetical protein
VAQPRTRFGDVFGVRECVGRVDRRLFVYIHLARFEAFAWRSNAVNIEHVEALLAPVALWRRSHDTIERLSTSWRANWG